MGLCLTVRPMDWIRTELGLILQIGPVKAFAWSNPAHKHPSLSINHNPNQTYSKLLLKKELEMEKFSCGHDAMTMSCRKNYIIM